MKQSSIAAMSPDMFTKFYQETYGINLDITRMRDTLNLCKKYYNEKDMIHAIRVANYTLTSPLIKLFSTSIRNFTMSTIYCIALAHDLLEDTSCSMEEILDTLPCRGCETDRTVAENALMCLTQLTDEDYGDYCQTIHDSKCPVAYLIKLADMKDHLTLTDTLTFKLINKYTKGLARLL